LGNTLQRHQSVSAGAQVGDTTLGGSFGERGELVVGSEESACLAAK
jgi:hypothetical protein